METRIAIYAPPDMIRQVDYSISYPVWIIASAVHTEIYLSEIAEAHGVMIGAKDRNECIECRTDAFFLIAFVESGKKFRCEITVVRNVDTWWRPTYHAHQVLRPSSHL